LKRWLVVALCVALFEGNGCTTKHTACNLGTLFVTVVFEGNIGVVDTLETSVTVEAGTPTNGSLRWAAPIPSPATIEIDFPHGYPVGQTVNVTLKAARNGTVVGSGTNKTFLAPGSCSVLTIFLSPVGVGADGGGADGGPVDASDGTVGTGGAGIGGGVGGEGGGAGADGGGSETSGEKANGAPCATNEECLFKACVDGVCCNSTCALLCYACNVSGSPGICSPVPVGMRQVGTARGSCPAQDPSSCGLDGTCDGAGACRHFLAGMACKGAFCQGGNFIGGSVCDDQGSCVAPDPAACAPFTCVVDGGIPACATAP
jgi:hypothetical protein